ncbi:MAG TPA: phosphoribosyltransferase [Moraxellaceae bacterium]|nr:phosphoribosyltransferase [Moraxellaceae bacterium]
MYQPFFTDRRDAGRQLAAVLLPYAGRRDVVVLGLPRGGVPVAYEVARALKAPLDIFVVRKLGVPGHEEYAMGAIASGGVRVLHDEVVRALRIPAEAIADATVREQRELERREAAYRDGRPAPELAGQTVLLVDDGLATGASMEAAIEAVREQAPARIVVAVPVAPADTCRRLRQTCDDLVCVESPEPFDAVGLWYRNFPQTTDDEVRDLLAAGRPS